MLYYLLVYVRVKKYTVNKEKKIHIASKLVTKENILHISFALKWNDDMLFFLFRVEEMSHTQTHIIRL